MSSHLLRAALALTASLTLAACGNNTTSPGAGPELPPGTTSTPAATTTPAGPAVNERGHRPKTAGQEADITEKATGETAGTFSIDSITVDPPCHEYGTKPDTGRTLLLQVRVATGANPDAALYLSGLLNPFSFSEIGADGVTRDAQSGACTDWAGNLPGQFGVNQKYLGTLELVVPEASGVLVLQNIDGEGGWEWTY